MTNVSANVPAFTYGGYSELVQELKDHGYLFTDYEHYEKRGKCVIMRHDIDYSIELALPFAEKEKELGVSSTYFVLLTSDFYNVYSKASRLGLKRILDMGHHIGLHFDEGAYPETIGKSGVELKIVQECSILDTLLKEISDGKEESRSYSYHRPSKEILDAKISVPNKINSYGPEFFHEFKYLSDSRRRWREPVLDLVRSCNYQKLHILTHAFWYRDKELSIHNAIKDFIAQAPIHTYECFQDNFTDLSDVLLRDEVDVRA